MMALNVCILQAKGKLLMTHLHDMANEINSDGNIRYFEYENDKFEFLSEYKSGDPQRGLAFVPRRGISVSLCISVAPHLADICRFARMK